MGGIIEEAFKELVKCWRPILDLAHEHGKVLAYELHPGSDVYDGATYEMFLDYTDDHPAACLNYDPSHFLLQQLDYLDFIRLYSERIKGFMSRTQSFDQLVVWVSMEGINRGLDVLVGFDLWVMAKLTSPVSSPCLPRLVIPVGRCWNGNVVSKVLSKVQQKGHHLSPSISLRRRT